MKSKWVEDRVKSGILFCKCIFAVQILFILLGLFVIVVSRFSVWLVVGFFALLLLFFVVALMVGQEYEMLNRVSESFNKELAYFLYKVSDADFKYERLYGDANLEVLIPNIRSSVEIYRDFSGVITVKNTAEDVVLWVVKVGDNQYNELSNLFNEWGYSSGRLSSHERFLRGLK